MSAPVLQRLKLAVSNKLARHWRVDDLSSRLKRPLASFTFDDFPRTAVTNGARLLVRSGYRGTFYALGIFEGRTIDGLEYYRREDLAALVRDGHEIGCHTFDHLRLPDTRSDAVRATVLRNRDFVREAVGDDYEMASFAYPYGAVSLPRKWQMQRKFPICRSIEPRVNAGRVDFAQLGSIGLESRALDLDHVARMLDEALARTGWVIFHTHDVSAAPSMFGCPLDAFERVVAMVAERGIDVLPVKNAAARVRFG